MRPCMKFVKERPLMRPGLMNLYVDVTGPFLVAYVPLNVRSSGRRSSGLSPINETCALRWFLDEPSLICCFFDLLRRKGE